MEPSAVALVIKPPPQPPTFDAERCSGGVGDCFLGDKGLDACLVCEMEEMPTVDGDAWCVDPLLRSVFELALPKRRLRDCVPKAHESVILLSQHFLPSREPNNAYCLDLGICPKQYGNVAMFLT